MGAYAIKLAALSNIHPISAVAGSGVDFVETLIDRSRGDTIVDYREGDEAVVRALKAALGNQEPEFAFGAVSQKGTILNICQVLNKKIGKIAAVLDTPSDGIPEGIQRTNTAVETSQVDLGNNAMTCTSSKGQSLGTTHFTTVMLEFIGRGLNEGCFSAHPHEVVPGSLHGLESALARLKGGSISATKLVVRISDTDGLGD